MDDWGGETRRTAALCSEIHNASLRVMRAIYNVAKDKVGTIRSKDFTTAADFEPKFSWERDDKVKPGAGPVSAVAVLKSMYRL